MENNKENGCVVAIMNFIGSAMFFLGGLFILISTGADMLPVCLFMMGLGIFFFITAICGENWNK